MTCEICGKGGTLVKHHVFYGTAYRKASQACGMIAWLCPECHTLTNHAVHNCIETDLKLKRKYQEKIEESHTSTKIKEYRASIIPALSAVEIVSTDYYVEAEKEEV